MKLLVLAQAPPPLHGQSLMVSTLLEGLPARGIEVHHVNLRLSRDASDIGRWRPGKLWSTAAAGLQAVYARLRHGSDTLYYVPAPGKRGALYRDWLLMLMCRPFFGRLVLHWHASGLSDWLEREGTGAERFITRLALGRADIALVLSPSLRRDAEALGAKRVAVVPNGIADPGPGPARPKSGPLRILFLGLGTVEKGVFEAAQAVIDANKASHTDAPAFHFIGAGPFGSETDRLRFDAIASRHPGMITHAGFVTGTDKKRLLDACHALCFPTRYAAEGQPLVVIEALAHDMPVIATAWRAIPEMIDRDVGVLVAPGDAPALSAALLHLRTNPPAPGICRARFLERFTVARHLDSLAAALDSAE